MADRDSIRALIRGVIEEEIGRLRPAEAGKATAEPPLRIDSDADLAAFARHVLVLARDPAVRADIEAGRHRFRLAVRGASETPAQPARSHHVDKGVVTEEAVARLPKDVSRLFLSAGVSITPLARDKARALGISVERIGR